MKQLFFCLVKNGCTFLRSSYWLKTYIYFPLKSAVRRRVLTVNYLLYNTRKIQEENGFSPNESSYPTEHPWRIGIIRDVFYNHESFIAACQDMKVAYKVVDLFASDWVEQVKQSNCDAFVTWPSECIQEWKRMYDERLRLLSTHMGCFIYSPYEALWLYGCKERQRDWMDIYDFPHPRTWVFYEQQEAIEFLKTTKYPVVAKTDIGAIALGVRIVRSFREGKGLIKDVFRHGIFGCCADANARQWRHLLFQEYLENVREWRIIRVGDSFFGHEKGKMGDFHSGSGLVGWFAPPKKALDLIYSITEKGGFRCLAMDVFEKPDGELLVNELQSIFGAYDTAQMYIDGKPGRYRRINGEYVFEEGRFCINACCNLRIEDLLNILKGRKESKQKEKQS